MTCAETTRRTIRVALALAAGAMAPPCARSLGAQQPPPAAASTSPVLSPYRVPSLALAQPAAGGTVPQDRPVIVLRFAAGEPDDPVDVRSLAVAVDGRDRSALFQTAAGEAWGSLAPPDGPIDIGAHALTARICSARGACASLTTQVSVVAPVIPARDAGAASRRETLIDLLLSAARKLLSP